MCKYPFDPRLEIYLYPRIRTVPFVVLINVETLLRARPTQHYDITRIIALLPIGGPIVPTGI